jgi:hypothetical protein
MNLELFDYQATATVPPWQDPARVYRIEIDQELDRDHVRESAVGRVGTNAWVHVVRVFDRAAECILAEQFATSRQAWARRAEIETYLFRNRQMSLL